MSLEVKIILFVLITFHLKSIAFARCSIKLNEKPALRPKILLTVGSRQVDLALNNADNILTIFEHQKIALQCKTKFKYSERFHKENKMQLTCGYDLCLDDGSCYTQDMFDCSSQQWNLYESLQDFVWCPKNTSSYILARPAESETKTYQYLAGVCYDTRNLAFKSLYHTISAKNSQHSHPTVLADLYTPRLELEHIKATFGNKTVSERDYSHPDIQNWIQFAKYNYSSIIQNDLLLPEYDDQFGSLLELVWCPNLRLGNWQRYELALKKHVESEEKSYDVVAGVSAVAAAPIIPTCGTNFTLTDLKGSRNNRIPLYIWNYLRSTTNSADEIVIIGVNSPFYEFYSESEIIFCPDKCQEIDWLKNVISTFRYRTLGVIFCCSSKDVISSQRLDGFPDIEMNTKPEITFTTTASPPLDD